eukprot:14646094-Alexandrium_andersonii.AAC.1
MCIRDSGRPPTCHTKRCGHPDRRPAYWRARGAEPQDAPERPAKPTGREGPTGRPAAGHGSAPSPR